MAANILDVISLELSGSELITDPATGSQFLDLGFFPVSDGYFGSSTMHAIVYTSNETGYRLTIKSGSASNALVHSEYPTITIPALSSSVTVNTLDGTGFPLDSWGYSLDTSAPYTFSPLLSPRATYPAALIADSSVATPLGETTSVTFAAKANSATPAGTYTNDIIFTATVDPEAEGVQYTPDFYLIDTMQAMNSTVCAGVNTPPNTATGYADTLDVYNADRTANHGTTTLIPRTMLRDTRDDHWYIVSKLADGNCWMTENLALASGMSSTSRRTISPQYGNVAANYTLPVTQVLQSGSDVLLTDSSAFSDSKLEYLFNGDGKTYKYSQHSNTGVNGYGEYRNSWDASTKTGHLGTYYSWPTATAGEGKNGAIAGGDDATRDICPKNWQLPSKNQASVLYTGDPLGYASNKANFDTAFNNGFVAFAGFFNKGSIYSRGSGALWWLRTSLSSTEAYVLNISGDIVVMNGFSRYAGLSVRCIAK